MVLQAGVAEGDGRIVAPLTRDRTARQSRVRPAVLYDGEKFVVMIRLLGLLPTRLLRHPVGSIAQYRDDLTRALGWLFWGI